MRRGERVRSTSGGDPRSAATRSCSDGRIPDQAFETTPRLRLVSGNDCSSAWAIPVSLTCARWRVTPGRNRPMTRNHSVPRSPTQAACVVLTAGSAAIGIQRSADCASSGPANPSGVTPTTETCRPLITTGRVGNCSANRCRHSRKLITPTGTVPASIVGRLQ